VGNFVLLARYDILDSYPTVEGIVSAESWHDPISVRFKWLRLCGLHTWVPHLSSSMAWNEHTSLGLWRLLSEKPIDLQWGFIELRYFGKPLIASGPAGFVDWTAKRKVRLDIWIVLLISEKHWLLLLPQVRGNLGDWNLSHRLLNQ
jgi:hypothetical protein